MKDRPPELYRLYIVAQGMSKLAKALGLHPNTVFYWERVPAHHLEKIYQIYGIHPIELRPDLFEVKPDKPVRQWRKRYKKRRFKLQWHEIDRDELD